MVRYPSFDTIRLIAAALVVFSHSFLLATGSEETEPLYGTGQNAGIYGVFVFFILSGFLIVESAKRSDGLIDYVQKRLLRIAPALVVSTLLTVYVICPPFAVNGAISFILGENTFNEAMRAIFLRSGGLYFPDVAFYAPSSETDFLPNVANGVLWTIRLEVIGYALIGLLMVMGLLDGRRQVVSVAIALGIIGVSYTYGRTVSTEWIYQFYFVIPALLCGVVMNWLVQFHRPRGWIAAMFTLGFIPAVYYHVLPEVFVFIAVYPLIWLGTVDFNPLAGIDMSYGTYLYGWPVTQVIRSIAGDELTGYQLFLWALPVTMLVALASWHFVEKPALRLKHARVMMTPLVKRN